ncbi:MAG: L-aspartate oxidase [Armatimonadetes bacterium]|nr:L-aspartate oxidase [Armatimonadota bacterium]
MQTDFLVIGSGIAGLTCALKLASRGRVALVTKKNDAESNTNYAQGGIASVLGPDDTFDLHVQDTLKAGAGLCHRDVVERVVREGPESIRELITIGTRFTTEEQPGRGSHLALGREGGHSRRRIAHAADLTGREVEHALLHAVREHPAIQTFEHHIALDLILTGNPPACCGAWALNTESGEALAFLSRATALATGGCGQVYLHTTNPAIATGDGVAMAYRAGARVGNMEFIQFHPTSLCHPQANSFLISEAVRGEGGILRLKDGSTFMEKYHPMGCLAPRDIVARAIDKEVKERGEESAYLDITHLEPEHIRKRFPNIYERCLSFGIDITREWIPVIPAAHYSCGGVRSDREGRTTIDRLFVCGEVAFTGLHGANRLASNSLLEALVFGKWVSEVAFETPPCPELPDGMTRFPMDTHVEPADETWVAQKTEQLRQAMWRHVGIVRTNRSLERALAEVEAIQSEAERAYRERRLSSGLTELRNLATVAWLIVTCALNRHESRGLHFNLDYPNHDDELWRKDILLEQGEVSFQEVPV